jgi:hypothetical protein
MFSFEFPLYMFILMYVNDWLNWLDCFHIRKSGTLNSACATDSILDSICKRMNLSMNSGHVTWKCESILSSALCDVEYAAIIPRVITCLKKHVCWRCSLPFTWKDWEKSRKRSVSIARKLVQIQIGFYMNRSLELFLHHPTQYNIMKWTQNLKVLCKWLATLLCGAPKLW